jgi:putative membrane protein
MRLSSSTPTIAAAILAALSLAASPVLAQGAKPATETRKGASSKSAETFVTKAATGGLFEVESSKVALQKAQRDDLKSFAQQMVDDHGKANQELMAEAQQAGIQVPAKLDSAHQSQLDKLNSASGSAF